MVDANSRTLERCEEEVRRLEEENAHLRQSAQTFGDLAERLRTTLDTERRLNGDRRLLAREEAADRRRPVRE
jgi:hypothetical protein